MSPDSTKPWTSRALLASSGTESKSLSVRITYWPFAYAYPFTMSFDSTGTLSFGHTYGRRKAVMHEAWSVVKDRSLLSVAPYNLTGMFTRPKAIAPLHRARAIDPNLPGFGM